MSILLANLHLWALSLFRVEFDYTLRNVVLGSAILGIVGGAIGCFAVLRRQSLISDTIAHAALPGICLAFIMTGTKSSFGLMIGAAVAGWIGTMIYLAIVRGSRIKEDAALGVVLSTFFGFGTVLLTEISRSGNANQAGLNSFLFGQAASLVEEDVRTMAIFGAAALVILIVFFKEFKLMTFDPAFAAATGYPVTPLTILLTSLIVVAVVIGLQAVGVILMVTVLVAPALAARQWTNNLGHMMLLASAIGGFSGVTGAVMSAEIERLPTGPTIVLISTAIVLVSILFAPERGVLWELIGQIRTRGTFRQAAVLAELGRRGSATVPELASALATERRRARAGLEWTLSMLRRKGLARKDGGAWRLTDAGARQAADAIRREQLWRALLARQMSLPADSVHLTIEQMERVLGPDVLQQMRDEEDYQASGTDQRPRGTATAQGVK